METLLKISWCVVPISIILLILGYSISKGVIVFYLAVNFITELFN